MSIRTSIILVVSLAMVAGYVFFVQIRQTTQVSDEPPWFYNVDLADMTRIAITTQGGEATFFLGEDSRWHLDTPEGLPVGLDRWGGITLLLSGPKSLRLLDEQPADLEPYGLALPSTSFEVDLKDGRTLKVLMGLPTPDGQGTYAQVEGFTQVFTIAGEWGQVLTRLITVPPYPEWYYDASSSTITSVKLQVPEKTVSLTKSNAGWHFDDEAQSPVDEGRFPSVLASLEKPTQTLVEYEAKDLARYGLDDPSTFLFLQVERPDEEGFTVISQYRFRIGNATEDGTGYYVQMERGGTIFEDVIMVNADWVGGLQAIVANPPYVVDAAQGS